MEFLTATQRRIMRVLQDGQAHTREELRKCLWDELGSPSNLRFHMTNLRCRLRDHGMTISSERLDGEIYYRLQRRMKAAQG